MPALVLVAVAAAGCTIESGRIDSGYTLASAAAPKNSTIPVGRQVG